jgi:hypothetical protein
LTGHLYGAVKASDLRDFEAESKALETVMGYRDTQLLTAQEAGALVELSLGGRQPVTLTHSGEQRAFLHDGDTVILRGWCEKPGQARIGFGECRGTVLPARG